VKNEGKIDLTIVFATYQNEDILEKYLEANCKIATK